jgi:hypothetical protein
MESTTPDTLSYLILGLVVSFGFVAVYIGTLISRTQSAEQDAEIIRQLEDDGTE